MRCGLLQVSNGQEVLELLTRSQRIFSDISTHFQYRLPKDVALVVPAMKQMLRDGIAKTKCKPNTPEADAEDMILFTDACGKCLRVTSGAQALHLLLHSQRAYDDLSRAELVMGKEKFSMSVIVRGWVDISPEWEFRAFVYNGVMTACTQYYVRFVLLFAF
jgi:hypothetical protein